MARTWCAEMTSQVLTVIASSRNEKSTKIASLSLPSLLPDLNLIEHMWDKLGCRVRNQESAVSKQLLNLLDSIA